MRFPRSPSPDQRSVDNNPRHVKQEPEVSMPATTTPNPGTPKSGRRFGRKIDKKLILAEEFLDQLCDLQKELHDITLSLSKVRFESADTDCESESEPSLPEADDALHLDPGKTVSTLSLDRIASGEAPPSISVHQPLTAPNITFASSSAANSGVTARSARSGHTRHDAIFTVLLREFLQSKRIMARQENKTVAEGTLPDCASAMDLLAFKYGNLKGPDPTNVLYDWDSGLRASKWNLEATKLLATEFLEKLASGELSFSDGEVAIFDPHVHTFTELKKLIPNRLKQTQRWWKAKHGK